MRGSTNQVSESAVELDALRPLYARALRLRYLDPGPVMCFCFFEGAIGLAALLAFAELLPWWAMVVLPAIIAVMVKINDLVAGAVIRSAATFTDREQRRFRQQVTPAVGRAAVRSRTWSPPRSLADQDTQVLPRIARAGHAVLRGHPVFRTRCDRNGR